MSCTSCHSMHTKEPDMAAYTRQCQSCHQQTDHASLGKNAQAVIAGKCIDCHMPLMSSSAIGFQKSNSKEKIPYEVRTHRIAVYPAAPKKKG